MTHFHFDINPFFYPKKLRPRSLSPNPAPTTFVILIKSSAIYALETLTLQKINKSPYIVAILLRHGCLKCVFWEETLQNYSAFHA